MAQQAKVTSIEALDYFRAALVVFLTKSKRSVADVGDEVRRTRMWIQHEKMVHWENEIRKRSRAFDQAEQEYMSARLQKNNETALMVRRQQVTKCKRVLEEAQEKMRRTKQWAQNFDNTADPILKQLEGLRQFLDDDMPKGIAYLVGIQRTLAAYAEGPPPETAGGIQASAPAPDSEAPPAGN